MMRGRYFCTIARPRRLSVLRKTAVFATFCATTNPTRVGEEVFPLPRAPLSRKISATGPERTRCPARNSSSEKSARRVRCVFGNIITYTQAAVFLFKPFPAARIFQKLQNREAFSAFLPAPLQCSSAAGGALTAAKSVCSLSLPAFRLIRNRHESILHYM